MKERIRRRRGVVPALLLIGTGVVLLGQTTGWIEPGVLTRWWPLMLVIGGVALLLAPSRYHDH